MHQPLGGDLSADAFRFLGLAFATADLLFEIDGDGRISFAAGAGQQIAGQTDASLIGTPWQALFAPEDCALGEALIRGLVDGERRGPVDLQMAGLIDGKARIGGLSVFRLPQIAPRLSCALILKQDAVVARPKNGVLRDRGEFEAMASDLISAAGVDGQQLELSLIELSGLGKQRQGLSASDAKALDYQVAGALRAESHHDAAAALGDERFAVLRRRGDASDNMARRLSRVLGAAIEPNTHAVAVDSAASPARMMRALRFALDTYLTEGEAPKVATLSQLVGHSVEQTVARAGAFGSLVKARRFKMVFQPVVTLADGIVRHHEALVRFEGDRSPFAMIRMAEELDIIEQLDLAVFEEVAKHIRADRSKRLRLAVNVSGRTIVSSNFIEAVGRIAKPGDLDGRLIFEITESSAIDDLRVAQRHIASLQAMGMKVCLDDFGSGASSFAYLQQLSVDVVKIDGAYVRELASSGRDDVMIRHLVGLCRELGVTTVAEMVETQAIEDVLRRAGVEMAQGWLYGQPAAEPAYPPPRQAATAARRQGAREQWS